MWKDEHYEQFVSYMEKTHPKMFSGQYGGFAIGPGWWHVVEMLCKNIQSYTDWKAKMADQFPEKHQPVPQVVVTQIKEKFGGLRFYYDGGDSHISGLVTMAEEWAASTCEVCSAPGTRRGGGWIKTLCDTHHQERENLRNE
jgi:hypothetical protein